MRLGVGIPAAAILLAVGAPRAAAQVDSARVTGAVRDSARAPAGTSRTDSIALRQAVRPPISPRRAFVSSLLAPGYAQSVLGRPNAAALFVAAEVVTITMIRESRASLREAQRAAGDSIVVASIDPVTGAPRIVLGAPRYPDALVRARKAQVEDWLAALLTNHLFAGIDAFVAAHLWDVPAQLSVRTTSRHATVSARVSW